MGSGGRLREREGDGLVLTNLEVLDLAEGALGVCLVAESVKDLLDRDDLAGGLVGGLPDDAIGLKWAASEGRSG